MVFGVHSFGRPPTHQDRIVHERERLDGVDHEAFVKSGFELVSPARMAANVESPENPRNPAPSGPDPIEEDEGPVTLQDPTDLVERPRPQLIVEVMRHALHEHDVDAVVRQRDLVGAADDPVDEVVTFDLRQTIVRIDADVSPSRRPHLTARRRAATDVDDEPTLPTTMCRRCNRSKPLIKLPSTQDRGLNSVDGGMRRDTCNEVPNHHWMDGSAPSPERPRMHAAADKTQLLPMNHNASSTSTRSLATRMASILADAAPASVFHPLTARLHLRAEPEMRRTVERCDPDGRALDIGAWYGPWTYWLSKRVRSVESFEPNPLVAAGLRAGVADNVTVHEVALSDRDGEAELTLHTLGTGSEGTASIVPGVEGVDSMTVPTGRVDDFEFADVRFIKIDVEGHEYAVVAGALQTIANQSPVVFVELEERMADIDRTIACFLELGYEGRFLLDGTWTSTTEVDLAAWQREFHRQHAPASYIGTVMRPTGYANNVAFVHPKSTWSPWS